MIAPETIDFASLPSIELVNRSQFPCTACVYFCLDSDGQILYIGRARNLKQRWGLHHRYLQLKRLEGVRIAYFNCEIEMLDEIEQAFISWFKPALNSSSVKREHKARAVRVREIKEIEVDRLGQRIKQFRLASPKSLEQICYEVGVTRTYWYDIEKETLKGALSIENLRKIEKVLGVDFGVEI